MTSSLYLELLDQKMERMDEEMFIPVDLTLLGDGEPFGMVIFNVDPDLVSSLEAMIRRGQAVQVRAMPETLQELRQSFDSTMVESLPVIESETSAEESEISADGAETGDEVESTADESEISTDEAETGDEVESTADESEISTDEAETGDEVESTADESEISTDEAETGDEVESTEDEAESGHEGGLSAYESEPVTNMTEEEAAEECCICCEELGDGRFKPLLKVEARRRPHEDDGEEPSTRRQRRV